MPKRGEIPAKSPRLRTKSPQRMQISVWRVGNWGQRVEVLMDFTTSPFFAQNEGVGIGNWGLRVEGGGFQGKHDELLRGIRV